MSLGSQSWGDNHRVVAQRWGLVVDDYWHIHGVIDRIPVAVMLTPHLDGRGQPSYFSANDCLYSALLPHPAPFWFNITEPSLQDRISGFFAGLVSKPTGHPEFDKRFAIHAEDPAKVRALLDDEAHAVLQKLAADHHNPLLMAQMLSLRRIMGRNDLPETIDATLRDLAAAAHSFARSFMSAATQSAYR